MSVLDSIRKWKRKRVLESSAIPEPLWREALETLSFVAIYNHAELARLRELAVIFLSEKSIVGGGGFEVAPVMRVAIAIQACVLILNLDPGYFDGWENVIVYPDQFVTDLEFEDDAGVVHQRRESLAGALMVQHAAPAVADAYCASRLDRFGSGALGTLPPGAGCAEIIAQAST